MRRRRQSFILSLFHSVLVSYSEGRCQLLKSLDGFFHGVSSRYRDDIHDGFGSGWVDSWFCYGIPDWVGCGFWGCLSNKFASHASHSAASEEGHVGQSVDKEEGLALTENGY